MPEAKSDRRLLEEIAADVKKILEKLNQPKPSDRSSAYPQS